MPFSEIIWWIVSIFLALTALFVLITTIWALVHPRVSVSWWAMFFRAALIAVSAGLAYGIWENFLR